MEGHRNEAAAFDQRVLDLYDDYVHGRVDRRGFLAGAAQFAVGGTTAAALLAALTPQYAFATQVAADDPRITTVYRTFPAPQGHGEGRGLLAMPRAEGRYPVVLVVHENRGLNPYIEDVARRLAVAGFIAFAPDALYPLGGYPGDEDKARELFPKLDQAKTREDFLAAAAFLRGIDGGSGRLGVVGFCYGGAMTNFLATRMPQVIAAAPFYGGAPATEDVPNIKAEMLVVLAGDDERVNAGWPAYEQALKAAGVRYTLLQPPGTQHGFNNDTTPRYDKAAAAEAWKQTIALFNRTLRSDAVEAATPKG